MEMPEFFSIKFTTLLLGALLLLTPLLATALTACAETAAAEPQSIAHVETAAYDAADPAGVGILNPDAEVRGVWIASVLNINFPSEPGLGAAALADELNKIVLTCLDTGINTIYFQVRPTADALYRSDLFPTSRYLTGEQGKALPGDFDPLDYLLTLAHANNIRVHAWVNPLRITAGTAIKPETDVKDLAPTHVARTFTDWAIPYADGK
ncbi:MAG: family 10 glycosylhydrolase, partial [Clostridia bacterium]|nr:family 10 glycosylhydrolase [Clostridia bacterium]